MSLGEGAELCALEVANNNSEFRGYVCLDRLPRKPACIHQYDYWLCASCHDVLTLRAVTKCLPPKECLIGSF
jgi:hypothetical protein